MARSPGGVDALVNSTYRSVESKTNGTRNGATATSSKPAAASSAPSACGSDMANGPGRSGGGGGSSSRAPSTRKPRAVSGASGAGPHTEAASTPPGTSTSANRRNAAPRSTANISPHRLSTTSKESGAKSSESRSP